MAKGKDCVLKHLWTQHVSNGPILFSYQNKLQCSFFHWVFGRERSWRTRSFKQKQVVIDWSHSMCWCWTWFPEEKNKHTDTSMPKFLNATVILFVNIIWMLHVQFLPLLHHWTTDNLEPNTVKAAERRSQRCRFGMNVFNVFHPKSDLVTYPVQK